MTADERTDGGLGRPPGRVGRLLYSRPAGALVAVMERRQEGTPTVRRLHVRRLPGDRYEPVPVRDLWESQDDADVCAAVPVLVYNVWRWEQGPRPALADIYPRAFDPPLWAGDWIAVRAVDLLSGVDRAVLDPDRLQPPPGYSRAWVTRLLGAYPDGSGAVCDLGLEDGGRVRYAVYEVSFADGLGRCLAELPYLTL